MKRTVSKIVNKAKEESTINAMLHIRRKKKKKHTKVKVVNKAKTHPLAYME